MHKPENILSPSQTQELLHILKTRFERHPHRHPGLEWEPIQARLETNPEKIWSLYQMEQSGGEPDVIGHDPASDQYVFCDCSPENPIGRRNLCYDRTAQETRRDHPPAGNVVDMAAAMGIELLSEEAYFALQKLGEFDTRTSSWLKTPPEIRRLGGAIFGDRRYNRVFIYHNSAGSYYSSRGFRGLLKV